ncbi:MAG: ABC transporter ATP-binding protein [Phycisphaerae bacterium]|nr:ABC transporter ATP-binding protein [Phycisphaerales bacterium]
MIDLVDITLHYSVKPVLRNLSLRVESGELVGVMGANGTGKSTLLQVAAGVLSPLKGYVEIDGIRRRSTVDNELAVRQRTVYLAADPWLPGSTSGREFMIAVGTLYSIDADRLIDHAEELIQLFHLEEVADSPISTYSSGQKKKAALCATLITETPVMILDEPFAGGLDPAGIAALRRILKQKAENDDITVLMASPVPEIVEQVAHRVAIIHHGKILACDTPEGLRTAAGCDGSLGEVMERLIDPEFAHRLDEYVKGERLND